MKPLHEHDCTKCEHLGTEDQTDFYVCQWDKDFVSVIARYSSVDRDYSSMPVHLPELETTRSLDKRLQRALDLFTSRSQSCIS